MRDETRHVDALRWLTGERRGRGAPRVVVVAAHPDDEVIGLGARIADLRKATFVHVTDGAPADGVDAHRLGFGSARAYACARRRELHAALGLAGIGPERACRLGYVDQEVSRHLVGLSRRLALLLAELRPDIVLTHAYEGGHPDHDCAAFGVHAACQLLRRVGTWAPQITEMTSYHLGPGGFEAWTFLPADVCAVRTCRLACEERRFKRDLMNCFASQRSTLEYFLPLRVERFRSAPQYDFTRPAHRDRLLYEYSGLGEAPGDGFCLRARNAMERLGITGLM